MFTEDPRVEQWARVANEIIEADIAKPGLSEAGAQRVIDLAEEISPHRGVDSDAAACAPGSHRGVRRATRACDRGTAAQGQADQRVDIGGVRGSASVLREDHAREGQARGARATRRAEAHRGRGQPDLRPAPRRRHRRDGHTGGQGRGQRCLHRAPSMAPTLHCPWTPRPQFDGGVRETPALPSDPGADHAQLVLEYLRHLRTYGGEAW